MPIDEAMQQALEQSWTLLSQLSLDHEILEELRQQHLRRDNPLGTLGIWLAIGHYPPPEVLITLVTRFKEYLRAAGKLDLETALIGRSRQRAGNHAARKARGARDATLIWEMGLRESEGYTQIEAAEIAVETHAADISASGLLSIDADTLARRIRSIQIKRK